MSAVLSPVATRPGGLAGPCSDSAWIAACVEAFGLRPHPIEVDGARAQLALVRGRLEPIGATLFEPTDLEWRDEKALEALAAAIAATRLPLRILRAPSDSPTLEALRRHLGRAVVVRDAGACPVLRLDGNPERTLSSRRRQDLRRAERRAAREGEVGFELLEPSADEVEPLLARALAVEASGWKGRGGTALAFDPARAGFYRAYARAAAAAGELRLAFLTIGSTSVAMQLCVERDGALWFLKMGYDERFAACSPGQILVRRTVTWAAERGLERCEFLGTAAPWSRVWTREERCCSSLLAYPSNLRGLAAAAGDGRRSLRRRCGL